MEFRHKSWSVCVFQFHKAYSLSRIIEMMLWWFCWNLIFCRHDKSLRISKLLNPAGKKEEKNDHSFCCLLNRIIFKQGICVSTIVTASWGMFQSHNRVMRSGHLKNENCHLLNCHVAPNHYDFVCICIWGDYMHPILYIWGDNNNTNADFTLNSWQLVKNYL